MEENKYITFIAEDGSEQEAEVVMCFEAGEPANILYILLMKKIKITW